MSRIGKQPVVVPAGVKVQVQGQTVRVEGPKGAKLEQNFHPNIKIEHDDKAKVIRVTRPDDERQNRALHGLTRNLIQNMVLGVTKGYDLINTGQIDTVLIGRRRYATHASVERLATPDDRQAAD